jgi:hypothetical protein
MVKISLNGQIKPFKAEFRMYSSLERQQLVNIETRLKLVKENSSVLYAR